MSQVDFAQFDKAVCERINLISSQDREQISELLERSQSRLNLIVKNLTEARMDDESAKKLEKSMMREAQKLERLMILEGVTDKGFFELQSNFRSMVRAANVIVTWLKGTDVSARLEQLRTQGIELLNDLYEHIKTLEAGASMQKTGIKPDKQIAAKRDQFVKVFTDFAILFRGIMAVADLFSEDPTAVSGLSDIRDAIVAVEREEMTDEPLGQALAFYDQQARDVGRGAKLFGKTKGHVGRFKNAVAKAVMSKSPGFSKMVDVGALTDHILKKSLDQLMAIFGRFNDFVANDVDVSYLLKISQNPRTVGSLFKSVVDAFSSGQMKTMR